MLETLLAYTSPLLRYDFVVRTLFHVLRWVYWPFDDLLKRVEKSPGVPVPNPTSPYWTQPPSSIAQCNRNSEEKSLPKDADIVIIGSGITGTSFARTILDHGNGNDVHGKPLRIVMLEARDACSGATGRNGGHITPVLYQDYVVLKREHGKEMAQKIIRFRLSHLEQLLQVAEEEGLLGDSQCRRVEAFDVFHDKNLFRQAKSWLEEYREDLPEESHDYKIYETLEVLEALQLSKSTVGCLSTSAGSVHPYRLVTGILTRLLNSYQANFDLFTHTPCTDVKTSDEGDLDQYVVETPRGAIRARHVVHATNGWASHLLPGMRGKIFPGRGTMTAQIPREGLGDVPEARCSKSEESEEPKEGVASTTSASWTGTRSFVFYPSTSVGVYDYLTQQLPSGSASRSSYPSPNGELMLGGGFAHCVVADLGNANDGEYSPAVGVYLRQALGSYFSVKRNGEKEGKDEVKATWSGILGISADERPWVGRIPQSITARGRQTDGGEWIAAGYTGEGMVHAWMSGKAVGNMVLGLEVDSWLPEVFRITEERWRRARFPEFVASHV